MVSRWFDIAAFFATSLFAISCHFPSPPDSPRQQTEPAPLERHRCANQHGVCQGSVSSRPVCRHADYEAGASDLGETFVGFTGTELCDHADNDCDGVVDEGCCARGRDQLVLRSVQDVADVEAITLASSPHHDNLTAWVERRGSSRQLRWLAFDGRGSVYHGDQWRPSGRVAYRPDAAWDGETWTVAFVAHSNNWGDDIGWARIDARGALQVARVLPRDADVATIGSVGVLQRAREQVALWWVEDRLDGRYVVFADIDKATGERTWSIAWSLIPTAPTGWTEVAISYSAHHGLGLVAWYEPERLGLQLFNADFVPLGAPTYRPRQYQGGQLTESPAIHIADDGWVTLAWTDWELGHTQIRVVQSRISQLSSSTPTNLTRHGWDKHHPVIVAEPGEETTLAFGERSPDHDWYLSGLPRRRNPTQPVRLTLPAEQVAFSRVSDGVLGVAADADGELTLHGWTAGRAWCPW